MTLFRRIDSHSRVFVIFAVLLSLDLALVLAHGLSGWEVFDLDLESNVPTWYSSAKLLGLSAVVYRVWRLERKSAFAGPLTIGWLIVALIFLGLSMDETAMIHNRLARVVMRDTGIGLDIHETVLGGDRHKESFAWVVVLSPAILAVVLFFLVFFVNRLRRSRAALAKPLASERRQRPAALHSREIAGFRCWRVAGLRDR